MEMLELVKKIRDHAKLYDASAKSHAMEAVRRPDDEEAVARAKDSVAWHDAIHEFARINAHWPEPTESGQ